MEKIIQDIPGGNIVFIGIDMHRLSWHVYGDPR